ncbi:F-box/LRR-repeat protein 2-like [Aphidius gifuensis]|uniref:F-box/LRR-repeat protein 2-like n=1 Tax=Aphidius gifuensis TaxID=684658 RepID=UPI001CDC3719|nr:F-box/LRR-repeat protein 2-like [Aphidius gifuensis]
MDKQKSFDDDFEDKIMALDYDSLAHIFMWLPVSERIVMENVCHKWKQACQRSWYDIKEYNCGVSIDDDEKILLRCGVYIRELTLTEVCDSSILSIVGERCKNLTKLEFVFDETSRKLKDLKIKVQSGARAIIILTELENLECLELNYQELTKEAIIAISNNCKKLKHLEIPYCQIKSCPFSLDHLSKLQYLEYLDLSGIKILQDSTIILIADECKHLKYLKIKGSNQLTEVGFEALTSFENLQKLSINRNTAITNNFVEKFKGLRVLNCRGCINLSDAGIIQVIKNCPDLERLDLCDMDKITLDTIIAADLATKNRINDIVLHIHISNWTLHKNSESIIESQWLLTRFFSTS